jgi:hypothetical protein
VKWARTILLTAAALAIVVVGAIVVSSGQDSADEPRDVTDSNSGLAPTRTREAEIADSPTTASEPPAHDKRGATTFVGRVDGGAGTLAVVDHAGEVTAYFCDGASLEAWLGGSFTAGRLRLSGDNGALRGSFDGGQASGSVRVEGQRFGFTLRQVSPPRGLYRVADTIDGAEVTGGWIVLPNGRQIGVLTVDGRSRPAPQLDPATGRVTIDGQTLTAQPV